VVNKQHGLQHICTYKWKFVFVKQGRQATKPRNRHRVCQRERHEQCPHFRTPAEGKKNFSENVRKTIAYFIGGRQTRTRPGPSANYTVWHLGVIPSTASKRGSPD